MTRCTICNHPEHEKFERKIVSKELTMSKAAILFKCNKSTVSRHMRVCFPKKVAQWVKPEATKEETLNVVNQLVVSHQKALEIMEAALADGDRKTALLALQTEIRQLDLFAKITGALNERPEVDVLLSPEYVELRQIIMTTLEPYPELSRKLSQALISRAHADEWIDDGDETEIEIETEDGEGELAE